MSWTTPRTWVTSETVTAALMNTHVRDNLNETCAPTAAAGGDIVYADAANSMGSRLAIGDAGTVLISNGSAPTWDNQFDYGDYFFSGSGGQGSVAFGATSHSKAQWTDGNINMRNYGTFGTLGSFGLAWTYNFTRTGSTTYDSYSTGTGNNTAMFIEMKSNGIVFGHDLTWASSTKAKPSDRMLMDNYRLDLDQGLTYLRLPVKTSTGDPTAGTPANGDLYLNTADNKLQFYADGAWRTASTW